MIRVDIGQLLPDFLLTDQVGAAMAAALAAGLQGFCACVQDGCDTVLDTEKMPAWRLDEMAWELDCLYDYDAATENKRAWIRDAIPLYASYGTVEAIILYLQGFFDKVEVEEYWQYGAEPYHFRVTLTGELTEAKAAWAKTAIEGTKNVRSILDGIASGTEGTILVSGSTEALRFYFPLAGELLAGEYP